MIEHYLYALKQESLIDFVGIRIFNAYGPRLNSRVISKFSNVLKINNDHMVMVAKRCFTYISDIIDAGKNLLIQQKFCDFYNVGNPKEEYSIKELAKMIQQLCENNCEIKYVSRDFGEELKTLIKEFQILIY